MKPPRKAIVLAGFVVLFWGTSATAFKIGLRYVTPLQLLFWSSLTASIVLFIIALFQRKFSLLWPVNRTSFTRSILPGILNPFLYYVVLFKAYALLPAQVAQPLNYVWPVVLAVLAAMVLKHPLGIIDTLALLVSFFGVMLISSQGSIHIFSRTDPLGVVLALSSSLIWAWFWIINMKQKGDALVLLVRSFWIATPVSLIYLLLNGQSPVVPLEGLAASAYIGIFEMGLTFWLWLRALNLAKDTAKLGNIAYMVPFVALVFIAIILKETIRTTTVLGLVLIVLAILYQKRAGSGGIG